MRRDATQWRGSVQRKLHASDSWLEKVTHTNSMAIHLIALGTATVVTGLGTPQIVFENIRELGPFSAFPDI